MHCIWAQWGKTNGFFTSVWGRSTRNRDGKRLEFPRQQREVAQQPEDHAAVPDHTVRSEQWHRPPALRKKSSASFHPSSIPSFWPIICNISCSDQEGGDLLVPQQHGANHGGAALWVAANGPGQPGRAALRQPSFLPLHRHKQNLHSSFRCVFFF